jgi:heme exporter protein A
MLKAVDLTLWRGASCLFEDLSFELDQGSASLVRGPNGSGKTTLLRVICGLTRPESGRVEWKHAPIESVREEYGSQLAYLGHTTGLKADLTVVQNLTFVARMQGQAGRPWVPFLEALELTPCADLELRYLSAGQQRRTALARVLMSKARLWLLDEPFTNLDDAGRDYVTKRIDAQLEDGGIALIATHQDLELRTDSVTTINLGERACI